MRPLMILAAPAHLGEPLAYAPGAHAHKIDTEGKCHGADGKFAKQELCKN